MSRMVPLCPDGTSRWYGVDTAVPQRYSRYMNDEERQLREALEAADGSPTKAAVLLGVTRVTVHRRMKKYGISIKRIAA
jgi:transcriptional regulator of acetoin/glycerol metabolism